MVGINSVVLFNVIKGIIVWEDKLKFTSILSWTVVLASKINSSLSLLPKISILANLIKSSCKFSRESFGTFTGYLTMLIAITYAKA